MDRFLWILTLGVILTVYLLFYVIGSLFNTDILNAVTPHENGFSVSFIGIFALFATSFLVLYIIKKYKDRRKN